MTRRLCVYRCCESKNELSPTVIGGGLSRGRSRNIVGPIARDFGGPVDRSRICCGPIVWSNTVSVRANMAKTRLETENKPVALAGSPLAATATPGLTPASSQSETPCWAVAPSVSAASKALAASVACRSRSTSSGSRYCEMGS